MKFAICKVPVAPVRKKPSHKVEMTNQLLFGEVMRIHKKRNEWVSIQSLHDGYKGWVRDNQVEFITELEANLSIDFISFSILSEVYINENPLRIPMGSSLPQLKDGQGRIGRTEYSFKGNLNSRKFMIPDENHIRQLTREWLNAPYLWGGRTILGVDCSGFSQMIYRMLGLDLKRDAWQQAKQGKKVKNLDEARCGDLAFFDDKEQIVHVGVLLSSDQIIHAAGCVRIDKINKDGIIHSETGVQTHRLRKIRRYW